MVLPVAAPARAAKGPRARDGRGGCLLVHWSAPAAVVHPRSVGPPALGSVLQSDPGTAGRWAAGRPARRGRCAQRDLAAVVRPRSVGPPVLGSGLQSGPGTAGRRVAGRPARRGRRVQRGGQSEPGLVGRQFACGLGRRGCRIAIMIMIMIMVRRSTIMT